MITTCKMQVLFLQSLWYHAGMKKMKKGDCRSCCPLSSALDILGDRWTLLVIRDMMFMGKHEYGELAAGPEGIATNILADRLQNLLCLGIIKYLQHPKHKSKKIYYLTEKGKDLLPIIVEMILWGGTHNPAPDLPKEKFASVKKAPKKFARDILKNLGAWEEKNL